MIVPGSFGFSCAVCEMGVGLMCAELSDNRIEEINRRYSIAVVVPVYNVRPYLTQCVDSLLAQTYPFAEIVLVDDGSTDGSGELCDSLASANAVVRVAHKDNAGLGYARNTGLDNVSTDVDYVMFVDSDDWLETNAVEVLVNSMGDVEADCVIGGHTKIGKNGGVQFVFQLDGAIYNGDDIKMGLIPRLCGSAPSVSDSIPMSVCSSLFKNDLIRDNNLKFPSEREVISEDFVFKFNYLLCSQLVVVSDFTQYCYRTNQGSLTKSYRPDRFEACLHFYDVAYRMIRNAGLLSEGVVRLQKVFLINLRMCISQERPRVSGLSRRQCLARIRGQLSDPRVQEVIKAYPVNELRWRQRVFVHLIQHRASAALFALSEADCL